MYRGMVDESRFRYPDSSWETQYDNLRPTSLTYFRERRRSNAPTIGCGQCSTLRSPHSPRNQN